MHDQLIAASSFALALSAVALTYHLAINIGKRRMLDSIIEDISLGMAQRQVDESKIQSQALIDNANGTPIADSLARELKIEINTEKSDCE
jgi:hypothetical protein